MQARGTTLLNLRCDDVEGGLLGRSLLTLLSNKGYTPTGGGKGATTPAGPLLPPHKFSPHDVVALRPSKGAADGPPIVQGVVYRVRDTSIVVAVDDAPEEGLDQPLRLEKLANEVRQCDQADEVWPGWWVCSAPYPARCTCLTELTCCPAAPPSGDVQAAEGDPGLSRELGCRKHLPARRTARGRVVREEGAQVGEGTGEGTGFGLP